MRNGAFRSFSVAALLAVAIGIATCGGQATTSSGSPAASGGTNGHAEAIHLVLTGGPTPGTFDFNSSDPCTFLTQPTMKLWGGTFGDNSPTATLVSFTLTVDVMQNPATFTLDVLTPNASAQQYVVSTIGPGFGSGSANVQDLGATARMSMHGQTKEGYGATATVQCNQIQRIGGGATNGGITNQHFTYQVSLTGTVGLSGSFNNDVKSKRCTDGGGADLINGTINSTGMSMANVAGGDVTGGSKSGTFTLPGDSGWALQFDPQANNPTGQYSQQNSVLGGADPGATGSLHLAADGSGKLEFKNWLQSEDQTKKESGTISWMCHEVRGA